MESGLDPFTAHVLIELVAARVTRSSVTLAADLWSRGAVSGDPVGIVEVALSDLNEQGLVTYRLRRGEMPTDIRVTPAGYARAGYPVSHREVGRPFRVADDSSVRWGDPTDYRALGFATWGGPIERMPLAEHVLVYPSHDHSEQLQEVSMNRPAHDATPGYREPSTFPPDEPEQAATPPHTHAEPDPDPERAETPERSWGGLRSIYRRRASAAADRERAERLNLSAAYLRSVDPVAAGDLEQRSAQYARAGALRLSPVERDLADLADLVRRAQEAPEIVDPAGDPDGSAWGILMSIDLPDAEGE